VEFGVESCSVCGVGREVDNENGRWKGLAVRFVSLVRVCRDCNDELRDFEDVVSYVLWTSFASE